MTSPTTKIKSLLDKVERVEISKLKVHPRNPRRGDVDRIAQSLEANSQYRPIVVQNSTGYIIAGNHTYLGARKLGWSHLDVVKIDVTDKAARKIMLADNRTSDAGSYDDNILAEVLRSLEGDVEGTGYYDEEIDRIISGVSEAAEETLQEFSNTEMQTRFNDAPLGEEEIEEDGPLERGPADFGGPKELAGGAGTSDDDMTVEKAQEVLPGMLNLKNPDEVTFPKLGYWGITELDQSMFMHFEELPEKLVTWAESFSRNKIDPHANDPETWWFYNWGMSSTQGMEDTSKVIVSFYSPDNTFENWWYYPERYVAKLLNSKIKYAVVPDFSMMGDDPHVIHLHQLYRSRWLGRYMQEAGIRIIPNVCAAPAQDQRFLRDYVLATLPVGLPMISVQMQTFTESDYDYEKVGGFENFVAFYQAYFDVLKPQGLLLYAGRPGQEFFEKNIKTNCPVRVLDSRLMRLNEFDNLRRRKPGI